MVLYFKTNLCLKFLKDIETWPRILTSANTSLSWITSKDTFVKQLGILRESARRYEVSPDDVLEFYIDLNDALITTLDVMYGYTKNNVRMRHTFRSYRCNRGYQEE